MPLNQYTSESLDPTADRPAAVDEWGIYDPSQAGLAALFERVEEKRRATDRLGRGADGRVDA